MTGLYAYWKEHNERRGWNLIEAPFDAFSITLYSFLCVNGKSALKAAFVGERGTHLIMLWQWRHSWTWLILLNFSESFPHWLSHFDEEKYSVLFFSSRDDVYLLILSYCYYYYFFGLVSLVINRGVVDLINSCETKEDCLSLGSWSIYYRISVPPAAVCFVLYYIIASRLLVVYLYQ